VQGKNGTFDQTHGVFLASMLSTKNPAGSLI